MATLSSDLRQYVVRSELGDPAAAARALSRLGGVLGRTPSGVKTASVGDLTAYLRPGHAPIFVGVHGGVLVAGNASVPALDAAAGEQPAPPPPGAQGALDFVLVGNELRALIAGARGIPAGAGALITGLGDISGWVGDDASGLRGQATLTLR